MNKGCTHNVILTRVNYVDLEGGTDATAWNRLSSSKAPMEAYEPELGQRRTMRWFKGVKKPSS